MPIYYKITCKQEYLRVLQLHPEIKNWDKEDWESILENHRKRRGYVCFNPPDLNVSHGWDSDEDWYIENHFTLVPVFDLKYYLEEAIKIQ